MKHVSNRLSKPKRRDEIFSIHVHLNQFLQVWDQLTGKPRVFLDPDIVAPRRMRQWKVYGLVGLARYRPPVAYGFGQGFFGQRPQIEFLRVKANEQKPVRLAALHR